MEKLEAFLESAKLFADFVDAENATAESKQTAQATVLHFVKTRLTVTAGHVISQAKTLVELREALEDKVQTNSRQPTL